MCARNHQGASRNWCQRDVVETCWQSSEDPRREDQKRTVRGMCERKVHEDRGTSSCLHLLPQPFGIVSLGQFKGLPPEMAIMITWLHLILQGTLTGLDL